MSELTDDRPHEPILTSQGGFVYNKPWIDYWEARALKAEAAHRALLSGKSAVLPQTKEHAEHLYTVAVACLKTYGVDVEADLRAAASTSTEAVGVVNIGLDGVARWPNGDPVALTPPTELTDDRLLSCPFCGFPGVLAEETHDTNDPYVYCSNDACGVGGPGFPGGGNTRDEAIAAWNRRAAVGVRALEWMSVGNHFKADRYAITVYAGMANPFKLEGHSPYTGYFPTLDAAKAAAQADYEARIRSCLTPPTPKVTTDEAKEQNAVTEKAWQPIETAPKHPVVEGWTCGPDIYLRPSWGGWTVGRWVIDSTHEDGGWFEFLGEDGPQDEQPTHWQPLAAPSETFAALSARSP